MAASAGEEQTSFRDGPNHMVNRTLIAQPLQGTRWAAHPVLSLGTGEQKAPRRLHTTRVCTPSKEPHGEIERSPRPVLIVFNSRCLWQQQLCGLGHCCSECPGRSQ